MSQATEIMYSARNANAAMETAEKLTNNIDQDWENEATIYTFDDESVLLVSVPQLNAYESMEAARTVRHEHNGRVFYTLSDE